MAQANSQIMATLAPLLPPWHWWWVSQTPVRQTRREEAYAALLMLRIGCCLPADQRWLRGVGEGGWSGGIFDGWNKGDIRNERGVS